MQSQQHIAPVADGVDTGTERSGLALRGALAGATATAVLLGGFGAFALWQHRGDLELSDGLQTGRLSIEGVRDGAWTFAGDIDDAHDDVVPVGAPIDPARFRVSPGDVLEWTGTIDVIARASDLIAEVSVDPADIVVDEALVDFVTLTAQVTEVDSVETDRIVGSEEDYEREVTVAVRVEFRRDFGREAQHARDLDDAVTLDGLALTLEQVTGAAVEAAS